MRHVYQDHVSRLIYANTEFRPPIFTRIISFCTKYLTLGSAPRSCAPFASVTELAAAERALPPVDQHTLGLEIRYEPALPYEAVFVVCHQNVLQYSPAPLSLLDDGTIACELDYGGVALACVAAFRAVASAQTHRDEGECCLDMIDPVVRSARPAPCHTHAL